METTFRRPAVPGIELAKAFGPAGGRPGRAAVPGPVRGGDRAGDRLRRLACASPARTIYLLDVSGSMQGARLKGLQTALLGLSGADTSLSGSLTRFNGREQVVMLPFSTTPKAPRRFDLPETDRQAVTGQIRGYVRGLAANGDTAIYDGARSARTELAKQLDAADPGRFTSIVLLTDGERTVGRTCRRLSHWHAKLPAKIKAIPVFTLLFGEAHVGEMTQIATLTGGRTFDARGGSLAGVFKEIRGYQ